VKLADDGSTADLDRQWDSRRSIDRDSAARSIADAAQDVCIEHIGVLHDVAQKSYLGLSSVNKEVASHSFLLSPLPRHRRWKRLVPATSWCCPTFI